MDCCSSISSEQSFAFSVCLISVFFLSDRLVVTAAAGTFVVWSSSSVVVAVKLESQ